MCSGKCRTIRRNRLRGQADAINGIAPQHHLVDLVVRQPGGVVAVRVAAAQAEDPLPD